MNNIIKYQIKKSYIDNLSDLEFREITEEDVPIAIFNKYNINESLKFIGIEDLNNGMYNLMYEILY